MEFKFRAVDNNKPTPTPTPLPSPLSTITTTYVSHPSLPGGFSSMVPTPNNSGTMLNLNGAIQRELEKEQIRRKIMAGEIARRRVLEEEVRRELMLEREWAMQRNMGQGGFSFQERVAMLLNPTPPLMHMHPNPFHNICPVPQLPQLMAPEIKPSLETNKDKVIILAKPDPDLYGSKRKVVTPPAVDGSEHSPFDLKKKSKEWSCVCCQVNATSERALNEHLQGRKHKAKEAALRIGKCGLDAKVDGQSIQPGVTCEGINEEQSNQTVVDEGLVEFKNEEQLVQRNQNAEDLKKQNGIGMINALKRRKTNLWCEICEVRTCSQIVMESHKKGRKHLARMKKFSQNDRSSPPTSTVSLETTGLIRDIDAVNPNRPRGDMSSEQRTIIKIT